MRRLLLLLALVPTLALAQAPAGPAPELYPRFGVSAAAGVPDGVVLSGVYRPLDFLRLSAGGSWNWFGFGLQGGAGVAPFHWPIDPTLDVEVGHYFESDMRWVADQSAGVPTEVRPLLAHVGYSYANAQLGVELGSARRFVLFARVGLSYLWTTARGSATTSTTSGTGQPITVTVTDPAFRATIPSLKLGVLFYL